MPPIKQLARTIRAKARASSSLIIDERPVVIRSGGACSHLPLIRTRGRLCSASCIQEPVLGSQSRFLSRQPSSPAPPSTTATNADGIAWDKWRAGELATPPRPIFPWRHQLGLLPRLVDPNSDDGGVFGPGMPGLPSLWTFLLKHLAMQACGAQLNIPWYQRILSSRWKHELAEASGWAFAQAVGGVLSNTYRVPFGDIVSNETNGSNSDIVFDHVTKFRTSLDDEELFPEAEYMMEEHLRNLYEAAHDSGKEQMRILLRTKPISSKLESLLLIPFLTRDAVKESPALRHTFRNIGLRVQDEEEKLGRVMNPIEIFRSISQQMQDLAAERVNIHPDGYGVLEGTVIAQVLVYCDEVFAVEDLVSEKVIQGDGQRRTVPHLVRLEMMVETRFHDNGPTTMHTGSWQITDWDDLLDGNLWFV